ncbi:hypothetical protein ELI30_31805 (plasmid) [Rhizobium leguminosarum]|nr:hypothetical protein ELI40_33670 [Rhizobium leguminosarum]TAV43014.1 hypothetical protein ELI31_29700 [Rhizobium leguminosarum]TAV43438.1 hypothetical protein ELI32_32040 [Rhizobium leguminosarum]TAV62284.1 hypothetical protein ELI30_31805 [Rhizobium leguminosarum]TAX01403.1 hypothetical protein ELI07_35350 [Rhizobium leguminosarum]
MSKNDIPPRVTPTALPDRLRNDGWWLTEAGWRRETASKGSPINMLIVIEKRHLREEHQWAQPTR